MQLPIQLAKNQDMILMQNTWSRILNPMLANPLNSASVLPNVSLTVGSNVINHKLGQKQQGWFLTDIVVDSTTIEASGLFVRYGQSQQESIPNADTLITFDTKVFDGTNNFNIGTSLFTAPVAGFYTIAAAVSCNNTSWVPGQFTLIVYKNGSRDSFIGQWDAQTTATLSAATSGSTIVQLNKGDTIGIYANAASTTNLDGVTTRNYFTISLEPTALTIYRPSTAAFNDKTLTLVSNVACMVNIGVF